MTRASVASVDWSTPLLTALTLPAPSNQKGRTAHRLYEQEAVSLKGMTTIHLPAPSIQIQVEPDTCYRHLKATVITATATGENGQLIGTCKVTTWRNHKGAPSVSARTICLELDGVCEEVGSMCAAIYENNRFDLMGAVNVSTLIVAQRLEVCEPYRGTRLWKELLALCLRHALKGRYRRPQWGYLKAFPLAFEDHPETPTHILARAERQLRLLYAMNIGARVMRSANDEGCFMQFPIGLIDQQLGRRQRTTR